MSTALEICQTAYRKANLGSPLQAFGTSQAHPFNLAIDLINTVIMDINRGGRLYFLRAQVSLPYSASVSSYNLTTYSVDPRKITQLRRASVSFGKVDPMEWEAFQRLYRSADTIASGPPSHYAIFNNTLELSHSPDQDYSLELTYTKETSKVTGESDTLDLPENDEDVLHYGILAYLTQDMGRADAQENYAFYQKRLGQFYKDSKGRSDMAIVRPRGF